MDIDKIMNLVTEFVVHYGLKLVAAIAIWIIGVRVIKFFVNRLDRLFDKWETDEALRPFLKGVIDSLLKISLGITALSVMGVEMTSFVAILGAVGLAIGMALSGTLQNFAGGVMILLFKPFRVGDLLESPGYLGIVKEIQIFNTILTTLDNKTIILPNGNLSTSPMTNYSTENLRRVDWTFGIAYGDNADKAESVLKQLCEADKRILKDPPFFIAVSELADSSVNFTVRAWVKNEDYWDVFFDMNKKVYETFGQQGLNIPYPQLDVHLHNNH